jgi:hypothetical protein
MSHTYSLGPATYAAPRANAVRSPALRRPYRTLVFSLMVVTSCIALYDLYLFAASGFH